MPPFRLNSKKFEQKWPNLNQKLKQNSGEGHSIMPRHLPSGRGDTPRRLRPSALAPQPLHRNPKMLNTPLIDTAVNWTGCHVVQDISSVEFQL